MTRSILILILITSCSSSLVHAGFFGAKGKFGETKWTLSTNSSSFDLNYAIESDAGFIISTNSKETNEVYFINLNSGSIIDKKTVPRNLNTLQLKTNYHIYLNEDKDSIYIYDYENNFRDALSAFTTEKNKLSPWYLNVVGYENTLAQRMDGMLNIQRLSKKGFLTPIYNIKIDGLNHIIEYEFIDDDFFLVAYSKINSFTNRPNTFFSSYNISDSHDKQPSSIEQLWTLSMPFDFYIRNLSPHNQFDVYRDFVFTYDDSMKTRKIDIKSGKIKWVIEPKKDYFYTEHTLLEDTILLFSGPGMSNDLDELKAFHTDNGKLKWSYEINEKDYAILGIKNYGGHAIIAIHSRNLNIVKLLSIDVDTGTLIDKRSLEISDQLRESKFTVIDDLVLIQTAANELKAIELN